MGEDPYLASRANRLQTVYKTALKGQDMGTVISLLTRNDTQRAGYLATKWTLARAKMNISSDFVGYKDGKLYVTYQDKNARYISAGVPMSVILDVMGCPKPLKRRVASRIYEIFNPADRDINLPSWNKLPTRI